MGAAIALIICTLLILGVCWSVAIVFRDIVCDQIWRRRSTWRFSTRSMIIGVAVTCAALGLWRRENEQGILALLTFVGAAWAFCGVVRMFSTKRANDVDASVIRSVREASQPIGPPLTEAEDANDSQANIGRLPKRPRPKWWLKRYDPTLPTNAPRF